MCPCLFQMNPEPEPWGTSRMSNDQKSRWIAVLEMNTTDLVARSNTAIVARSSGPSSTGAGVTALGLTSAPSYPAPRGFPHSAPTNPPPNNVPPSTAPNSADSTAMRGPPMKRLLSKNLNNEVSRASARVKIHQHDLLPCAEQQRLVGEGDGD